VHWADAYFCCALESCCADATCCAGGGYKIEGHGYAAQRDSQPNLATATNCSRAPPLYPSSLPCREICKVVGPKIKAKKEL